MTNVTDALQELQRQFVASLPARIEALRDQYQKFNLASWQADEVKPLHQHLHGLTGAAGTFGFQSVSAVARQLENRVLTMIQSETAPDEATWQGIGAELDRIEQLAQSRLNFDAPSLRPPAEVLRLKHAPLVYLVEDDAKQAEHLSEVLRDDGYRVRIFASATEFHSACKSIDAEIPDAVVIDMTLSEGDVAGAELLAELKADKRRCPPVVFVSVRDDLQARLAAFRAGASRYLTKPVESGRLIDLLDALTGRQPPQPYRVLLVDDDPLLLEVHAAMLRSNGMEVQVLSQPLRIMDALSRFAPDVVVLDVYMPEATGAELAAVVRERDEYLHLPILFLSAESDMTQQLLALNLGGDDFLVKPVQPDHLVSTVTARARRARQSGAIRQRLETTLYEREREHLALNHHAIVSISDAAGNITNVNDKFCEISGYSRGELLGKNHRIVKSGEHPPEFYQNLWFTISSGTVWQGGICNRRKDGSLYWVESTITPFLDGEGIPYQYVSMRTDITQMKAAEAAQRAQNAMREVVGEAAAALLVADAATLDDSLERCLQRAGEHLGADRAYLFQLDADGVHMSNSHEWCAPGIAPQKDDLVNLPMETFGWWWVQMEHGDMIDIPDVAAMPPESAAEQALLQSQNIGALCAFPIQRAGKTAGFIGFDQVATARHWDAQAIVLLDLLAGLMDSALVRAAGEQALAKQQIFTQSILDSVGSNIVVLDRQGVIVAVNDNWRRFSVENSLEGDRAAQNASLGANYLDVCGKACAGEADSAACEAVEGIRSVMSGRASLFTLEYPCHSSTEFCWFELRVSPMMSDQGHVVVNHALITERKIAEQAVEAHKERLRRGQLFANIGTWDWNIQSGELLWTERIAPLFGYPVAELETSYDNFLAAIHPDDRQAVIDAVNACVECDVPYEIEHRVVWPDGTVRWLLERGAVVRDAGGRPLSMLGVVQDIDDRKRAELALAERERLLREAQTLASIGNWTADLVTGELIWSDEIYRIFGHEPRSFAPSIEAFHTAIHPDDRALVRESEIEAEKSGRHDVVHRIVRPDGTVRHVHELAQAQSDAAGKLVRLSGTVQDITEQVEAEQALIAARDEADRANKAKSEFLSSMSHELRTPMNAVLGFGQLMEYDDTLPGEHLDSVREILKAGHHLLELINEVLDLAKVESGQVDLSLEPVEVCPIVYECLGLVGTLADKRNIQLSHLGLAGAMVRADRTRLKQSLLNLLANAIKYNREGGSVRLDVRPEGEDRLRIRVMDTGPGIPLRRLAELFQPFNRLDAEGSDIEGTGIGLTITQRIVEMMGGAVGVESEVGIGSTFWIELPLEGMADAACDYEGTVSKRVCEAERMDTLQHIVLYIEDNPTNIKLVTQILGRYKHIHLLTAHTPELGIELALAHHPELILLDINMPGMDGYQVLEVFKADARLKAIPVVAVTANAMARDIERGKTAGFTDYLTKPLDVERFYAVVDACLAITEKKDHA